MKIIYAGFGAKTTYDITKQVQSLYAHGKKEFDASVNTWGDPDPGDGKSLFIVWEDQPDMLNSATATEPHFGNVHSIKLP